MDAVEWLRALPDASVDLVVTDPAYESLEKHRAVGTTTRLKHSKAYAGSGFSEGVLHLLQSSEHAAYCLPDAESPEPIPRRVGTSIDSGTWQLDHILAITFGWWDVLLASKQPICAAGE
jgi:hypothetical protein